MKLNYKMIRLHNVNFIAKKATMFAFENDIIAFASKNKLVIPFICCYKTATFLYSKKYFARRGVHVQLYFSKI